MSNWDRVTVLFANEARSLVSMETLTLADLLRANCLPPSMFQSYEVPGDGSLFPVPITQTLASIPETSKVILQCMRNTDANLLATTVDTRAHSDTPVAA